jgi:aromatic-L-amino-acid decarboxylase
VIAFRLRAGDDEAQAELLRQINASQRVFLSSTRIRGTYWIRVCIVSHRTHADRVDECADLIATHAAALAG